MTNDLKLLKKKLINQDKMVILFESMGCENIKYEQGGNLITSQLPPKFDSTNARAVQCRLNESLSCYIRNRGDFSGDIFSLVSYIEHDKRGDEINKDLYESKRYICETLGWEHLLNPNIEKKKDYLSAIRAIKKKSKTRREITPNEAIDESTYNNFIMRPVMPWIEEGISYETQLVYEVGFDIQTSRIVFPFKNRLGQLIGFKGRLINDRDVTDYNPKYKYIYRFNVSQEWFNLDKAMTSIREKKEVIFFESEKSVMKMYSNNIYNCLAISSSDISDIQRDIILTFGYDYDIILAYDKDKTNDEISEQAEKFTNRDIFAIVDVNDLLREKDSPIDRGIDVWNELYANSKFQVTWKDEEGDE